MKLRAAAPRCALLIASIILISTFLYRIGVTASFFAFIIHGQTNIQLSIPSGYQMGSVVTPPQHGSFSLQNSSGAGTFSPAYGYVGLDSFVYSVCQSGSNCQNLTADLDIRNNAPTPTSRSYQVHASLTITNLLANDADPDGDAFTLGDAQHVGIVTSVQHGGLSNNGNNNFSYAPALGFTGQDSFVYQICDQWGL